MIFVEQVHVLVNELYLHIKLCTWETVENSKSNTMIVDLH